MVASFAVLAFAWRAPRRPGGELGRPLPRLTRLVDARRTRWTVRLAGLVVTSYAALGLLGPDRAQNPTAGVVFVLVWVGVPLLSALVGPLWRQVSPLRTLHLLLSRAALTPADRGLRPLAPWVGLWPAAAGLLAFTWLELVAPDRATLPVLRLAAALYVAVLLVGAVTWGARWFAAADPFEAWSSLAARVAPVGRRTDRRLGLRDPVAGLDTTPVAPGLAVVVCVLLGSTAYDSASGHPGWARMLQESGHPVLLATLGLLGFVGFVGLTYAGAAALAGVGSGLAGRRLPDAFAPSLVPIALGYLVAHYLTLLVLEGQRTVILLSDPLVRGADWLGLSGRAVDVSITQHPAAVASVQVLAVVTGHVVGVVAAHDRALRVLPPRTALRGQLPLLAVMVLYTVGGLSLLFAA